MFDFHNIILSSIVHNQKGDVMQTDADFTPLGKRKALYVRYNRQGWKCGGMIVWYVAGRRFRELEVTHKNIELSQKWAGKLMGCP